MYKPLYKNNKRGNQQDIDPFGITFHGSIANSIAQMLKDICRLFRAFVDWIVWKFHKSMKQ